MRACRLEFHIVDVFTQVALEGNALAVFPDARGLDTATMQRIAQEENLSETAFVFPPSTPSAVATVRIFTPKAEMPFAGHPTVGTAFVLRKLGKIPAVQRFAFDEGIGAVPVRVDDAGDDPILWLMTPPIERGATFDAAACARALELDLSDLRTGVPCRVLSAGNPCLFIPLVDRPAVDRAIPDPAALRRMFSGETHPPCVFVFTPTNEGAYSRMFAPHLDVVEDPATGSATGPLARYMMDHGFAPTASGTRFTSEQGTKMGRRSLLHVLVGGEGGAAGIEVGGNCVHVASGTMELPGFSGDSA